MNSDTTIQGKWFLPGDYDKAFSGTLSYTRNEGCFLEVLGSFEDYRPGNTRQSIILGTTLSNGPITLVNCSRRTRRTNLNDVTVSRYFATFALIGHHFQTAEELVFDKLTTVISDIETWIGIYGCNKLELGFKNKAVRVDYQLPSEQRFELTNQLSVFFEFESSFPLRRDSNKIEIIQKSFIGLGAATVLPFKELLGHFFTLYKFICLAYFDSPNIIELNFINSIVQDPKHKKPLTVQILYSDNFFKKEYKSNKAVYEFLFVYDDIKDCFSGVVGRWFELFEIMSPAVNLLNELLLKRRYPLELKFLSAIQAIETLHRSLYGGEVLPKDQHEQRMNAILTSVPDQYRTWLREKLEYSNEPNLRRRLKDLYERVPVGVISKLIYDKKGFINGVVNTRNYFTHYNTALKAHVLCDTELYKAIEQLKVLLACLILNELHFSKDDIVRLADPHKLSAYL